MQPLTEEVKPNSRPAVEQPGLCMRPQVPASPGGRGDRGEGGGPAPHSPLCPPSPCRSPSPLCSPNPCPGLLEALGEHGEEAVAGTGLPGPQTAECDWARAEREWEPDLGQELPQRENEKLQELSQWEDEKCQDLSRLEFERDQELSHGEDVRCQEPSQRQDGNGQELYKPEDKRVRELSEGELDPELYQRESDRHQELSKWLDMGIQELSQEENSDRMFPQWEHFIGQELSEGEVRQEPELSQRRDIEELQEGWEEITIHTIWVNPKYPQLLQDIDTAPQDLAKAAACPALAEQVQAAGPQSQGPALQSPCCPPGPSAPQPGAQALREQPAPPKERPSRSRRVLRALRALFCCPCLRPQPDNQ
ncbi:hypothetical protein Nmel_002031 [Mimus melanotis]